MPLVSYRASAELVLHEIREVAGHRQSAKQLLNAYASSISFTTSVISATASFASLKSIFVLSA